jgi:hypothetical protein
MFRKLALASLATIVGMVIASKVTAGKHKTLSELLDPRRSPSVTRIRQMPQSGNEGAKRDRPSFTPTVAHSAR